MGGRKEVWDTNNSWGLEEHGRQREGGQDGGSARPDSTRLLLLFVSLLLTDIVSVKRVKEKGEERESRLRLRFRR